MKKTDSQIDCDEMLLRQLSAGRYMAEDRYMVDQIFRWLSYLLIASLFFCNLELILYCSGIALVYVVVPISLISLFVVCVCSKPVLIVFSLFIVDSSDVLITAEKLSVSINEINNRSKELWHLDFYRTANQWFLFLIIGVISRYKLLRTHLIDVFKIFESKFRRIFNSTIGILLVGRNRQLIREPFYIHLNLALWR